MSDERLGTLQQVLEQRHAIIMELVETCGIHKAAKNQLRLQEALDTRKEILRLARQLVAVEDQKLSIKDDSTMDGDTCAGSG